MTQLDPTEELKLALEDSKKINHLYAEQLKAATLEIKELQEMVSLLKKNLYGRSKEKVIPDNQLSLFDSDPEPSVPKPTLAIEVVKTYRRKKSRGRKKLILDQYPRNKISTIR